jgi:SAM-dependent methyltransferase
MERIEKRYDRLFQELAKDRYKSFTVFEYFILEKSISKKKVNVVLRIDVDCNLYFAYLTAKYLKEKNITASFYFLPFTEQYNIWENQIVKEISLMGFEVGLHSDHYSRQIQSGIDGISAIKEDVAKFSTLIGKPPEGMVFHVGEDDVENWHIYKYLKPQTFGLKYHDGFTSNYHHNAFNQFYPHTDYSISDYYIVPNGWKLRPFMPKAMLKRTREGETIHITIHPTNMFKWWKDWPMEYGKKKRPKEGFNSLLRALWKKMGARGIANLILISSLNVVVILLQLVGKIFFAASQQDKRAYEKRTSYCGEKEIISEQAASFWESKVKEFDLIAGKRVLDLGCGIGQWLIPLSHHNKKVVGIDPCYKSLILARQTLYKYKIKNSVLMKGQGEALPFKPESFDYIFCYGVLMYTREYTTFSEIVRVLKKGGRVFIAVDGSGYFLKNMVDGIKFSHPDSIRLGLIGLANSILKKNIFDKESNLASFFTYNEIKALFKKYGLKLHYISPETYEEGMPLAYMGFPYFFKAMGEKL